MVVTLGGQDHGSVGADVQTMLVCQRHWPRWREEEDCNT